jgi:hypothetical protein
MKAQPNIKRALKRQEIVNRWTNVLVVNEMRRLKKQRMIAIDIVLDFENTLSSMTDDNYKDSVKYLESILNSLEKIWM